MKTPLDRYEVGHKRHGLDSTYSRKVEAFRAAIAWMQSLSREGEATDDCITVYDRMARRGCTCHWTVKGGLIVGTGMRLAAIAFLLLLLAPAAHAEMLLLELGWENPEPVTLPAEYIFDISSGGGGNFALWRENVSSFPHTSLADPELVDRFNLHLGWFPWDHEFFPIVSLSVENQAPELPRICTSCYWRRLVANLDDAAMTGAEWAAFAESVGWNVNLQVPLLGQGLRGYEVTRIERSVTAEAQTIRLYGNVVPEPACCLLVIHLVGQAFLKRNRRPGRGARIAGRVDHGD
jgi:hypothetical protein